MLYHQTGKVFPIDQYNFATNLRNIDSGIVSESGCSNENPLVCSLCLESPGKLHNIGSSHSVVVPTLRLNIYDIKSEFIFLYYPIDATIPTFTDSFSGVSSGAAIAHFHKQLDYNPLKKRW
jgi:hypothetical protein